MQRTVEEFRIDVGLTRIPVCPDATPLAVGAINGKPVIWVETSPDIPDARIMTVAMITTLGRVPTMGNYLGTVRFEQVTELSDQTVSYVGHVYTSLE